MIAPSPRVGGPPLGLPLFVLTFALFMILAPSAPPAGIARTVAAVGRGPGHQRHPRRRAPRRRGGAAIDGGLRWTAPGHDRARRRARAGSRRRARCRHADDRSRPSRRAHRARRHRRGSRRARLRPFLRPVALRGPVAASRARVRARARVRHAAGVVRPRPRRHGAGDAAAARRDARRPARRRSPRRRPRRSRRRAHPRCGARLPWSWCSRRCCWPRSCLSPGVGSIVTSASTTPSPHASLRRSPPASPSSSRIAGTLAHLPSRWAICSKDSTVCCSRRARACFFMRR